MIVFHSTKLVSTSLAPLKWMAILRVTLPEKVTPIVSHKEGAWGEIEEKTVFNRKNYGMNKGIPFVKIGDDADATFDLKVKHASGPQVGLTHPV